MDTTGKTTLTIDGVLSSSFFDALSTTSKQVRIIGSTWRNVQVQLDTATPTKLIGSLQTLNNHLLEGSSLGQGIGQVLGGISQLGDLDLSLKYDDDGAIDMVGSLQQLNSSLLESTQLGEGIGQVLGGISQLGDLDLSLKYDDSGAIDMIGSLQQLNSSLFEGTQLGEGIGSVLEGMDQAVDFFSADNDAPEPERRRARQKGRRPASTKRLGNAFTKVAPLQHFGQAASKLGSSLTTLAKHGITTVITGLRALGIALMTNPIGLIIGGIALAAGLIYTFWKPIKGFFAGLWGGIKPIFSTAWSWFKKLLSFSPLGLIINNWSSISQFFSELWSGIVDQAKAALDWLIGKFKAVADFMRNPLKAVTDWFSDDDDEQTKAPKTTKPSLGVKPIALAATVATTPIAAQPINSTLPSIPPANAAYVGQPAAQVAHYNNNFQITIQQQPGQNAQALADEMIREIERKTQAKQRRVLHD